jgi:hypothetical protein
MVLQTARAVLPPDRALPGTDFVGVEALSPHARAASVVHTPLATRHSAVGGDRAGGLAKLRKKQGLPGQGLIF